MSERRNGGKNQGILLLAALASIRLAQGLDSGQLQLLGAFFTVLGDNMTLLGSQSCDTKTDTEN